MKYKFWILVIIVGGVLMIVGNAIGSAAFYEYLISFVTPYIAPEYMPPITAILTVLQYIAYFGGYSVLVGVFLIIMKLNKVGRIIITVATSFGMLGIIIYVAMWAVGYFNIALDPVWQTLLDTIYGLFTFNSGLAFTGTVVAVVGKFGLKKSEKTYEEKAEEAIEKVEDSDKSDSKFCPECGAKLPAKANFCNKCGKNFD